MPQQAFSVSENVQIQIRGCRDRVVINGWDDAHNLVVDAAARQEGNTIVVENARRVMLRAPRTAQVRVSDCHADIRVDDIAGGVELDRIQGDVILRGLAQATVRDLDGDLVVKGVAALRGEGSWQGDAAMRGVEHLEISQMEGDLSLGDVGAADIQGLEGDFTARDVRGPLRLGDVGGDANLRQVQGDVTIARLSGDLVISGLRGAVDASDIEGDAVVSFEELTGATVVRARGDVVVNLPVKADADVQVDAPHGDMVVRAPLNVTRQDENHLQGTLGNGGIPVRIESLHDDVVVRMGSGEQPFRGPDELRESYVNMGQDFADMGRRIAEETRRSVEESLRASGIHGHSRHHHVHERRHADESAAASTEAPAPKPKGPVAGSPERQAILDAIARGELSVDDAIRKLRGEE